MSNNSKNFEEHLYNMRTLIKWELELNKNYYNHDKSK